MSSVVRVYSLAMLSSSPWVRWLECSDEVLVGVADCARVIARENREMSGRQSHGFRRANTERGAVTCVYVLLGKQMPRNRKLELAQWRSASSKGRSGELGKHVATHVFGDVYITSIGSIDFWEWVDHMEKMGELCNQTQDSGFHVGGACWRMRHQTLVSSVIRGTWIYSTWDSGRALQ
ncbi:hypothetical protein EJ03DRAFT_18354 [Teratosphaeria nubilosa]|uniref:Uncharacterized protein n=1 Tax=Teratosphaeria nubilosa TaxID=161662 RepID=A0A6G1KWA0_9PEZI|nr:hypothetical protein EJ03DRAFT_18354 [Teratosphaeria nubilosa]